MLRIYDEKGKSMIAQEYDGMYYPYPLTDQNIGEHFSEIRNMPSKEDDVLITSYPKSGTHWLLEAVHMLMNSTDEYFRKDFPSPNGNSDGLPLIEYMITKELETIKSPRLMMTHLMPQYIPRDFKGKIINITRNPKDVAVSYYNFVRSLKAVEYEGEWNDFIPIFTRGKVSFGFIFDHLKQWKDFSKKCPENKICFLKYEELHKDFVSTMAKVSIFLGLKVEEKFLKQIHVKCDFQTMRKSRSIMPDKHAASYISATEDDKSTDALYRKGVVGDWKHWFTVEQSELFDHMAEEHGCN